VGGEDLDPRGGGTWFHCGGSGMRFGDGCTHWNSTNPTGLTGSADVSGWSLAGARPAVAHVFQNGLWGSWQFQVANFNGSNVNGSIGFGLGGWQESRGGGISTQPYYVEGVFEELDEMGEWWFDQDNQILYVYPNSTEVDAEDEDEDYAASELATLIHIEGGENVTLDGLVFTQARSTFLEKHVVPSGGDWAYYRGGAVEIFGGTSGTTIRNSKFLRNGGNDLMIFGAVTKTVIEYNEFAWSGDSSILSVGDVQFGNADGSAAVPTNLQIRYNEFHDLGIYGKQSAAFFSALSCSSNFSDNVLYNGPRAGINLNDGFCGGHTVSRNVIFNFVREVSERNMPPRQHAQLR